MKKLLLIIPLALILCLAVISQVKDAETSSEDLEKELRATIEKLLKANKENDLDTKFEIQGDAIGYGYRSKAPRIPNEKLFRAGNKMFWNSMETFEVIPNYEDTVIRIFGNVGVILGSFTEKFKPKGGELQTIEVRTSMTFAKIDGKWKQVQYHRDTQFAK
jgi:hypothetical protein